MRTERKYPLSFDSSQCQLNLFFTRASTFFRSIPLPTSIMVVMLSKISQKCPKMRAVKHNLYDHDAITMYTTQRIPRARTHTHTHTVHMALVGYLIVFSIVTKCGQTIEFLLWGTIVPLNFLVGYHCSIVASTPQPMAYAFIYTHTNFNMAEQWASLSSSSLSRYYRFPLHALHA